MVVLMVGLSFTWWQQTEIIEVYTFNAFFFLSFALFAFRDLQQSTRKNCIWVGFWLGLGLLTHIQGILSLPFFLWYLGWPLSREKIGKRVIAALIPAASFLLLMLPAIFLELHSVSAIFFDNHFRSNVMEIHIKDLAISFGSSVGFFLYNFHLFSLFILVGIWRLFKDNRKQLWGWAILLLPYLAFAVKYNVRDAHVFFLSSYLLLAIASAWGWQRI